MRTAPAPGPPPAEPLPRVIWTYWDQGFERAPGIVRACRDSWARRNPGWELRALDAGSAPAYADVEAVVGRGRGDLTVQKRSNLLRLQLLATHGGVWVDATCLCARPLDEWLPALTGAGFFAFRDPGPDRPISSWFLASARGNPLTRSFCEAHGAYLRDNRFSNQGRRWAEPLARAIDARLSAARRPRWWLGAFARRVLRIHPYFIIHYHFAAHLEGDPRSRAIFEAAPYRSADAPQLLRKLVRAGRPRAEIREAVRAARPPLHKLTWKGNLFPAHSADAARLLEDLAGE